MEVFNQLIGVFGKAFTGLFCRLEFGLQVDVFIIFSLFGFSQLGLDGLCGSNPEFFHLLFCWGWDWGGVGLLLLLLGDDDDVIVGAACSS